MHERKNAPPAATGKRAIADLHTASYSKSQPLAQAGINDLAILTEDHPCTAVALEVGAGVAKRHAGKCVVGYDLNANRTKKPPKSKYNFESHRLREIETVFRELYPIELGVLPTTDNDAETFAIAIADHVNEPNAARAWAARHLALVLPSDSVEKILAAKRRRWTADGLARLLGVTQEIRTELGLRTIGAIGSTKVDRAEERKRRDRDRKRAQRAKEKCGTTRPISAEEAKPWEAAGVSRSTWYARGLNKRVGSKVATRTDRVRNILEDSAAEKKQSNFFNFRPCGHCSAENAWRDCRADRPST